MKKLIILLTSIILFSCTKEAKMTTTAPLSDRLVFKNFNEFNETYLNLQKLKSLDDLRLWAQAKNHSTLLNSSDTCLNEYSNIVKTILNKDSEFEIGDSIVLFNQGNLYTRSKRDMDIISYENNPEKFNKIGYIKVTSVDGINKNERQVNLGINQINAKWQHEFSQYSYQPCGGSKTWATGCRKFVNEIVDETVYSNYVFYSHLYIRVKLEWKNCNGGKWQAATEQREVHIHIVGSAYWYPGGFGGGCGSSADYTCSTTPGVGPIQLPLMNSTGAAMYTPFWTVLLNGSISQHILGDDTNTAWVISGTDPNGYLW